MTSTTPKKVRVPDLALMKQRGERIVMLTAYDATMARLLDRAGIDLLLVGDSLGNVIMGLDTTIPVTLDVMIHHTRAVARGANRALVVADMPFLTYQVSPEQATHTAKSQVEFTFSWKREKRWEGRNVRVEVFENAAGEQSTAAQSFR